MTTEERIAELERQLASIKKQSIADKREQLANHLIQKFGIEDDNDIILDYVLDHLNITETTDITAIVSAAEESYKAQCKRAGRELSVGAEQWIKERDQKAKEEAARREAMNKILK